MADCHKHYFCVPPSEFKPLSAVALAITSAVAILIGAVSGNVAAGIIGGAFWIAAVFELCHFLHGGKLICLEKGVCAIGRVAAVHPVGADKSGFEKMDDDFTFDLILAPHAANETKSEMIASDSNQGRFIADQTAVTGLGLGYVGDSVAFPAINPDGHKTEILHAEIKGCRVHDVCIVLKVMSVPTAIAASICAVPVLGWIGCLLALLAVLIVTAIIGGIVWAATHNGALSDVMDPASGDLVPADDEGNGGDVVLIRGDWVYDAGHSGWNEFHPIRHAQKIVIDDKFMGTGKASADLVAAFKREVYDPWCSEVGKSEDPLVVVEQGKPGNGWQIHPSIDGCEEPPVIK
ncbi:hypothetical protein QO034_16635 [Sedimentitalea sp. JM2-8]|uniref:Uncharacterized protein n=1 Tax=Sedimentitalea xiamensis TaxID=3050037 RepID=A0ABT7FI99_9RHOB|nr:hypothetical protein [Sedimentitalea xiamensis]MDK3074720.1 hypothetical protein [Sedimentitalea xiamensis]